MGDVGRAKLEGDIPGDIGLRRAKPGESTEDVGESEGGRALRAAEHLERTSFCRAFHLNFNRHLDVSKTTQECR